MIAGKFLYKFLHPSGLQIVDGDLPEKYNKLDIDVSVGSLVEATQNDLDEEHDEEECEGTSDVSLIPEEESFVPGEEELENQTVGSRRQKWMVSKFENGKMSYIHISQALKLLLPREYIARCRQKRHWASKFLPGKEPLNPEHDIVLFGNIAIKKVLDGNSCYQITRVERIESTKDGTEILSFRLTDNPPVRVRCSLYDRDDDGHYQVTEDIVLTPWKSPKGILSAVELLLLKGNSLTYRVHETSCCRLEEMGYVPYGERTFVFATKDNSGVIDEPKELDEGFYEIEEVLERRLNKDFTYEYKVRFNGYGPEDDMWLPSSAFNRTVAFESTSKFGRKRKHTTEIPASPLLCSALRNVRSEDARKPQNHCSSWMARNVQRNPSRMLYIEITQQNVSNRRNDREQRLRGT